MQVDVDGTAKHFKLQADTRSAANMLIPHLTQHLRETFDNSTQQWTLKMDITCLRKSPSLSKLKELACTLDELRPALIRHLQHTTIVCNTKLQRLLIGLVFKIHPPSTPIQVVVQDPLSNSCGKETGFHAHDRRRVAQ